MKFIYNKLVLCYSIMDSKDKNHRYCGDESRVHPVAIFIKGAKMAYLDDNNDHLYTAGDPLEALDKELAELKASLKELDGMTEAEQKDDPNPKDH